MFSEAIFNAEFPLFNVFLLNFTLIPHLLDKTGKGKKWKYLFLTVIAIALNQSSSTTYWYVFSTCYTWYNLPVEGKHLIYGSSCFSHGWENRVTRNHFTVRKVNTLDFSCKFHHLVWWLLWFFCLS